MGWLAIAAIVIVAVIGLAVAITRGGSEGTLPGGDEVTLPTAPTTTASAPTTTPDEPPSDTEVPLCRELAAESGAPVPDGSWVDVTKDLGAGGIEVALSADLHVAAVAPSDDAFTVTRAGLDMATCGRYEFPDVTACQVLQETELHRIFIDVPIPYPLIEGEWVWQRFVHGDWAFVGDAFVEMGWTEASNLECCTIYDLEYLPLPGDEACLSELRA